MKTLIILMGVALMVTGCCAVEPVSDNLTPDNEQAEYIDELETRIKELEDSPVVIEIEVIKEVPAEPVVITKIVYVDRIVTVNQTVEVPIDLKDFETAGELTEFILADRTNEIPSYWTIGGIKVRFWCFNYAETLRDNLHEAGYHANIQGFGSGTQLPMSDRVLDEAHGMINVVVDGEIWLVEPKTDEHWKAWDITEMEIVG